MEWSLFRRRGSDSWFVEWHERGERRESNLGTADEAEAEQRAGRLLGTAPAEAAAGQTAHADNYTLEHALNDFLQRGLVDKAEGTRVCYEQRAGHLLRRMGSLLLASLHVDQVSAYIAGRLEEKAARESIRKELCVLRRAIDLAHRRGHACPAAADVMPRFKTQYVPRKTWLSAEQCEALLAQLPPHRRLFVLVCVYTGARLSEVQRLEWTDINFAAGQVHLRGKKTDGSDRVIPLAPRLAEELQAMRAVRGRLLRPWGNVRRDLARACKDAGVARVTPNDLRRTFASWLVQAGESSYVVGQLLGHASSTMVERVYGRLSQKSMREAIAKLPQ